jgi:methyl-accepting chemotaxis protein
MRELSTGIEHVADKAQSVSSIASLALDKASVGNEAIQTVVNQMNSINTAVAGLGQLIEGLGERSQEIEQISAVITGISSQTNLLALNAAIEAARAGEYGRGFAVVASEVRQLAEQSSESAQQISNLIALIQKETSEAVRTMESATHEVVEGIGAVHTAGQSFEQIRQSVNEVANQVQEVSDAVQQMSVGTKQVTDSIQIVTEVAEKAVSGTQNVSAVAQIQLESMKEINYAASSLSTMAEQLQLVTEKFNIDPAR